MDQSQSFTLRTEKILELEKFTIWFSCYVPLNSEPFFYSPGTHDLNS